jgi:hypothetical protein
MISAVPADVDDLRIGRQWREQQTEQDAYASVWISRHRGQPNYCDDAV